MVKLKDAPAKASLRSLREGVRISAGFVLRAILRVLFFLHHGPAGLRGCSAGAVSHLRCGSCPLSSRCGVAPTMSKVVVPAAVSPEGDIP